MRTNSLFGIGGEGAFLGPSSHVCLQNVISMDTFKPQGGRYCGASTNIMTVELGTCHIVDGFYVLHRHRTDCRQYPWHTAIRYCAR